MEFNELDPLLHNQLRLAVMSILLAKGEAEFNFIKEKSGATAGNLSAQISKLKNAGYLEVNKSFKNNYPLTTCKITDQGILAFERYVDALQSYIKKDN